MYVLQNCEIKKASNNFIKFMQYFFCKIVAPAPSVVTVVAFDVQHKFDKVIDLKNPTIERPDASA